MGSKVSELTALAGASVAVGDLVPIVDVSAGTSGSKKITFAELVIALGGSLQPLDATLTALAGANWAANALPIGSGADTVAQVTFAANKFPARASTGNLVAKDVSDFGLQIVNTADAAALRTLAALGAAALLAVTTDTALAGDSDSNLPTERAVKRYVDSVAAGLKWKQSVRVATTANGTLATAYANGQTVDGVTLATGDRILLKDQSTGAENGIYIVAASGAPARSTDADAGSELVSAAVFVQAGTANADKAFVCTNDSITLESTSVVFTGFGSVLGALIAANNLSDVANAGTARTNLGLAIGSNVQAYDAGLAALAAFNTNGLVCQTADNTFAARTITGTANQVSVANGDGVSANPTLSLPQDIATTSKPTFGNLNVTNTTLTYGATTDIDMSANGQRTLTLAGDVTFTTSNRAADRSICIRIIGDASSRNFTFPGGWKFIGAAAPTALAANKIAILTITCFGSNDSDVVAAYAAEP